MMLASLSAQREEKNSPGVSMNHSCCLFRRYPEIALVKLGGGFCLSVLTSFREYNPYSRFPSRLTSTIPAKLPETLGFIVPD